jgi:nucleotide-binding universal stress UspA family protein
MGFPAGGRQEQGHYISFLILHSSQSAISWMFDSPGLLYNNIDNHINDCAQANTYGSRGHCYVYKDFSLFGRFRTLSGCGAAGGGAGEKPTRVSHSAACLSSSTVTPPFTGAPSLAGPLLDKYIHDMHTAVLARTLPVIKELGVCCEVIEEVGGPVEVIARIANTQDFDLVVIGSRGVSMEKAEKLGSICHGVIHSVFCPVLIVR